MNKTILLTIALAALSSIAGAQDREPSPVSPIGGLNLSGWTGVAVKPTGAAFEIPGTARFQYPAGPKGWYVLGFRDENDGTRDWRNCYGIQLQVFVPKGRTLELKATIKTPAPNLRQNYLSQSAASTNVTGYGWRTITLPLSSFDFDAGRIAFLEFIQNVEFDGTFTDGKPGQIMLKDVHLVAAQSIGLFAAIKGTAIQPGQSTEYRVAVSNCTDSPQDVSLKIAGNPWLMMAASVKPSFLHLPPNSIASADVTVTLPADGVPEGGHETQTLLAIAPETHTISKIEFVTARDVARPSILLTASGWDAVREKVKNFDWAKKQQDALVAEAEAWQVPIVPTSPINYTTVMKHEYVFTNINFVKVQDVAEAWQLTRNKSYAEKVALFLRRLADPKTGYPETFAGTDMDGPQEGQNFQSVAMAYDAILDADVLSDQDKQSIAATFRLYMDTFETDLTVGNVGNWAVAQSTACLMCALAIGDLSAANRYIYGTGGFTDFVGKGIMDDGWWWECSTGYNMWVAAELTQSGLACRPWGIDLINMQVPASYSAATITTPWAVDPLYGTNFEKWGPNTRNFRNIKQLWDAIPAASDYRGIVFGTNDGHQETVGGPRLELAYYVYRDPAYATLIKINGQRDLIYGVPNLIADDQQAYLKSGYALNIGYSLLRSQTPGREPREQIQAVLKTGTQGGYHGHFDRASLDNVTRYGREFWSPESVWWGYPNYMYKFYVQTSDASNMVVVDQKMQEAVPSKQLMFYSGKAIQVAAVETNARWSDPPYGGMQYFPGDTFAGQLRKNVQSIPLATDRKYGDLGPYSDRVLQRRLAVVTDDYVVIADYLNSNQPHTFDNLFQMKDFEGLESASKIYDHHSPQFNPDPHSSAQFITDCDWYTVTAPAVSHFVNHYGPAASNAGERIYYDEPGDLNVDLRSLWPQNQQVMIGTAPLPLDNQQWVTYSISGDGKQLAKGESGMWILGRKDFDLPVAGTKTLLLNVTTGGGKKNTLFWGGAHIVTTDGKSIPIDSLITSSNIVAPPAPGKDYYGNPVKIGGTTYGDVVGAQPKDITQPSVISVDLSGINAARFVATLGSDYPESGAAARRVVYSIRTQGTEARYLTILEPYESARMIKSATAPGPNSLHVELTDGRSQDIVIDGFDGDGAKIKVTFTETKNGQIIRTESSSL